MAVDAIGLMNKADRKKVRFTIVGDGPEKESLEKQVRDLGLQEIVRFTGWVTQSETLQYYKNADVFCFPSVREFGGAVALEAMACGLPCIVPDHAGLGEYVTENTGFKIAPVSREFLTRQIAEKLSRLLKDAGLRDRMSENAIERVMEFEWNKKAERMVELYKKVLAENANRDL